MKMLWFVVHFTGIYYVLIQNTLKDQSSQHCSWYPNGNLLFKTFLSVKN